MYRAFDVLVGHVILGLISIRDAKYVLACTGRHDSWLPVVTIYTFFTGNTEKFNPGMPLCSIHITNFAMRNSHLQHKNKNQFLDRLHSQALSIFRIVDEFVLHLLKLYVITGACLLF